MQAIDPATGQVGAPVSVGTYPSMLAYDGARLWVANSEDGTMQAIDPADGRRGRTGQGPHQPGFAGLRRRATVGGQSE